MLKTQDFSRSLPWA